MPPPRKRQPSHKVVSVDPEGFDSASIIIPTFHHSVNVHWWNHECMPLTPVASPVMGRFLIIDVGASLSSPALPSMK